jgi:hypothetical protein
VYTTARVDRGSLSTNGSSGSCLICFSSSLCRCSSRMRSTSASPRNACRKRQASPWCCVVCDDGDEEKRTREHTPHNVTAGATKFKARGEGARDRV